MFNPQTDSPSLSYFHQQAASNPFTQRQSVMFTGINQFGQQVPNGPFAGLQPQATGAPFLQPQPTSYLQPQSTGYNPFRQSMILPQVTGFSSFSTAANNAFGQLPYSQPPFQNLQSPLSVPPPSSAVQSATSAAFPTFVNNTSVAPSIQRPQSTPILSQSDETLKPVVSHQTGSRNPFGIPRSASPPPVPKMPTLAELTKGAFNQNAVQPAASATSALTSEQVGIVTGAGMSNVASQFTDVFRNGPTSPPSMTDTSIAFTTHAPSLSSSSNTSMNPIQAQPTGFGGITPFKPSSSFGASLLEALPQIGGSNTNASDQPGRSFSPTRQFTSPPPITSRTTSPFNSVTSKNTLAPISESEPANFFQSGVKPSSNTSSTLRPLAPQLTGTPNPFRASVFDSSSTLQSLQSQPTGFASLQSQSTGFGSSPFPKPFQPQSSFGQQTFSGASGTQDQRIEGQNFTSGQQQKSNNPLISFT